MDMEPSQAAGEQRQDDREKTLLQVVLNDTQELARGFMQTFQQLCRVARACFGALLQKDAHEQVLCKPELGTVLESLAESPTPNQLLELGLAQLLARQRQALRM